MGTFISKSHTHKHSIDCCVDSAKILLHFASCMIDVFCCFYGRSLHRFANSLSHFSTIQCQKRPSCYSVTSKRVDCCVPPIQKHSLRVHRHMPSLNAHRRAATARGDATTQKQIDVDAAKIWRRRRPNGDPPPLSSSPRGSRWR